MGGTKRGRRDTVSYETNRDRNDYETKREGKTNML